MNNLAKKYLAAQAIIKHRSQKIPMETVLLNIYYTPAEKAIAVMKYFK